MPIDISYGSVGTSWANWAVHFKEFSPDSKAGTGFQNLI